MRIEEGRVSVVVLGIAQDAGVPHAGCRCERCAAAYADQQLAQLPASLAIIDALQQPSKMWLVDATPSLPHQLNLLRDLLGSHPTRPDRLRQPDGIFLTHAHMGHTSGLVHLGPEAMAVSRLSVFGSENLVKILLENRLWKPMLSNLDLISMKPYQQVSLTRAVTIKPIPVPHRDEIGSGTYAYQIAGPSCKLIYVPDIDSWEQWPEAKGFLEETDTALVDATFYSREELSGRDPVAHPLVTDTLAFFEGIQTKLVLTHLNHTNPLLDPASSERQYVESKGIEVAFQGQIFTL